VPLFNVTARGQNRGTAAPAPSKWVRSIDKSLLDDSKIVALSLAAEIPVQGWLNTVTPRLIIRCKENETSVYVNTGMSASVELNGHTVRIRLGTKPAVTEKWEESTDNKALFSPSPIDFARRIAATTSLIFEFTPFSANPVVTRFDVRGLKLDEISATCNWAKYDEAARQRAQQAKLGVLRLDTPLEIEGGISIPVPYGATPRIQGDPPQHITIFQVARVSDLKQFFEAGLSIYGWKPSADGCWLNKDQHLCLRFNDYNWVHILLGPNATASDDVESIAQTEPQYAAPGPMFLRGGFVLPRPGVSGTPIPYLSGARYTHTDHGVRDYTDVMGTDVVTVGGISSGVVVPLLQGELRRMGWSNDNDEMKCWTTTVKSNNFQERLCIDASLDFMTLLRVTPTRPR